VDPSTLELIHLLVEQGASARLLLLYTARPEFRPPWPLRTHHTQINLNRLTSGNVRTMVAQVAAKIALSDEIIATVVERTGGVPLFVEELTRAVVESGSEKLTGREIPATLHDSLMARLDRLGPAKEIIQVGAVIGSEFSYKLLHAMHPIAEEDLQQALHRLVDAELLYVRGIAPEATYQFKHALIRDAAYEALLKSRRKELHRLVARTIDEQFLDMKEAHPEVLARHWTEAGETELAITEWSRAGRTAESRSAFSEALESYRQALALIVLLPESSERDGRELELRLLSTNMLWITRGWASRDASDAIERAAALAEKSGNLKQLINLLLTKGVNVLVSGDSSAAVAIADRALELALREGNPIRLGVAHCLRLMVCYARGDLTEAEKYYTAGLKFFEHPGFKLTREPRIAAFAYASWNAWILGRADVARERIGRMIVNEDNPYDVALSEYFAAILRVLMREYEQGAALAGQALELSEKNRIPSTAASSRIFLGQALAHLGRATEGIELIRRGIAELLEMQGNTGDFTRLLAEAQEREGAFVDALATVEEALHAGRHPETLRLRGELRFKQGNTELAEADFRDSIALAQKMSARAWELRATMNLARLLASQGRRDEARAMLAEIYGWFTEGFDTIDLKEAKALLDEFST
jgi:tetratricopeptide (TPR) repeat protein